MIKKSAPSKTRVLVTGAGGYVGSVLTRLLLESGYPVLALDNFMYRQTGLLELCAHEGLEIIRGDCRDEGVLRRLLGRADVLIPLAALVGMPSCDRDRVAAVSVNRDAVRMLCRLSSRSQRILFPVTNSGYGAGGAPRQFDEEAPLEPISLYGRTKVEAEQAVLERGNGITFRFATGFGVSPRMRMDLLVNDFVHRAVTDRAIVVFEGHFRRDYIHVRDMARVFLHGLENFERMKGRPFNAGLLGANLSKRQLCALIADIVPGVVILEAPIGSDPDRRDHIVSSARLYATGFLPEWPLERGIRELVKAYHILRGFNPHANA